MPSDPSSTSNRSTDIYEEIVALRRAGRKAALATIVNVRGSIPSFHMAKMLVRDDGSIVGTIGGGCVEAEVWQAAREVMESERPQSLNFNLNENPAGDTGLICGGSLEVFVEPVLAPARLYLFGAGHISQAISRIATLAGFEVHVVDDREPYANKERFPEAIEVIATDFDAAFARLTLNESAYIVIATRGHRDDLHVLRWAVRQTAKYLAMIGSRRKVITTCNELIKEGVEPSAFANLKAPMGLDIGAVGPEEIAVSVVAEMIATKRNCEASVRGKSITLEYFAGLRS